LEIDPQTAADVYRERVVGPVRGALPYEVVASIEEQLSGACTTEIAAFDEFTALLTDPTLVHAYDHVVFDTAPTGHTIRLLQLPGAWNGFIETNPDGASCLGPLAGLEKQRQRYADAVAALADPLRTRMVLVVRAKAGSLAEAARTHEELAAIGLRDQQLVANGVLPEAESMIDPLAAALYRREQAALAAMPDALRNLPSGRVELTGASLVGVEALATLLEHTGADPGAPVDDVGGPIDLPGLGALVDETVAAGHGLVMTMGKGGVGKTTMAAAIAVALAERGLPVHLTTSDPAAHVAETLAGSLPQLEVSRIDPRTETLEYSRHVLETKGRDLDAEGLAMLEEDLRSPCTEEIAVFQAFSRRIRESRQKVVVMDTAPTGHTLMLLDATGSYHRDVTRHSVPGLRVTTPMMQLQDPDRTKVVIVTLPETTPVLEATRLQEDLRRAPFRVARVGVGWAGGVPVRAAGRSSFGGTAAVGVGAAARTGSGSGWSPGGGLRAGVPGAAVPGAGVAVGAGWRACCAAG
jgi:arsenite/tail-anchored protein-transporting ATPase